MLRRSDAVKILPRPSFTTNVNYVSGFNQDIISVLHSNLPRAVRQTREISAHFKGGSDLETARKIWDFLKREIKYKRDREGYQDIKLPGRFVAEGTGDCKSYSLFTAAILQNLGIPFKIRYTSYTSDPTPQHVYIITDSGIIIDGVWNAFNSQKKFTHKKDYPMQISTLAGVGCNNNCRQPNINGTVMLGDSGIGKLSLKKAAQSVKKAVKKTASKVQDAAKKTGVVKAAAKAQTAAKNTGIIRAAAKVQTAAKNTGIIKTAAKLQDKLKNMSGKTVVLTPVRRAYRTLVAVNFRGWANKLAAGKADARKIWEKVGGSFSELDKSIDAGLKRPALLGAKNTQQIQTINGIGEPVTLATIGSLLALAAPLIALFKSLTKDDAGMPEGSYDASGDFSGGGEEASDGDILSDIIDKVTDIFSSGGGGNSDGAGNQSQTSPQNETPQAPQTGSSNTGLYLLGAAAAAYFIFK